jgi:hypothetical protein
VVTLRQSATGGEFVAGEITVTVKAQLFVLPPMSVAVQPTVVVPIGNAEPDAGAHVTVGVPQLSATDGATKLTFTAVWPTAAFVTMFAGHAIVGGVESKIVTVAEHELLAP